LKADFVAVEIRAIQLQPDYANQDDFTVATATTGGEINGL
jgi:hypothetical protein